MKKLLIFICVGIALILSVQNKPCADFTEATLETPKQPISLALAEEPEEQAKGLGGCKVIPDNAGMYFQFPELQTQEFWMKDMYIPIDIVWITGNTVVAIEHNVPNMPLGTPDSDLPTYKSLVPVDAVLEVAAGKAREYGIEVGSELHIDKKEAVRDTSSIL